MATDRGVQLKKQAFIEAYCQAGTITAAARVVGIHRSQHYDWLKKDAEYAGSFEQAEQSVADMLEREAIRRAVEGVERPVYQGGRLVGTVQDYSDTLLIFLLKGHKPEKFKERAQVASEVTVKDGDSDLDREIRRLVAQVAGRREGGTPVAPDSATEAAAP